MILVDSSVWIDYFADKRSWQANFLDHMLSNVPIIMGDIILKEVLQNFKSDKDYETIKNNLRELPFRQMAGNNVAIQSAQNYRRLRKAGVTVQKKINIIIATFCIIEGLTLLHNDPDFDSIASHFPLKVFKAR